MAYLFRSLITGQKRRISAAALLVPFAFITGCVEPKRIATHLATPPERLVCEAAGDRPTIPPEYAIDWSKVQTVPQAKSEHERYVASIRTREGIVAGYVLKIEGRLFVCSNNAAWRRDYEARLP